MRKPALTFTAGFCFLAAPDLDLADNEASQCRNARKALRTLPALLNIKKTRSLSNRDRYPNPKLGSLSSVSPFLSRLKSFSPPPGWLRCLLSKDRRQWRRRRGVFDCFFSWASTLTLTNIFAGRNPQRGIRRWSESESVGSWRRRAGRTRPASSRPPSSASWTAASSPSKKVRKWKSHF